MPYDPRKVSDGGNQGIDDTFSRVAPKGKYRVVTVDTFDATDGVQGDYATLHEANKEAKDNSGTMLKAYVYDETGKCVAGYGSF